MAKLHTFLAFDCGATSGRGVLATFEGGSFRMEEVYRFPSEMVREGGRMYWDVLRMRDHFVACIKQLSEKGIRPDSIGIDTWGVDFGCIGADGRLLALPRCYRDPYTVGIPEKVYETVPRERLYARTGIQIMNFNTIFQLYAQTLDGDESLRQADALLFMPDLLSYLLTGNKVCEYTDASTSGMMDQASRQFNKGLLEECRRIWKAEGKDYSYAELMDMAIAEKDFSGRINPDDPRFAAPENMVQEIADQVGNDASDAQIVSCIYHSLADRYKEVLDMLQSFAPFKIEKLHIIGGGSANALLNQWTADAIGIPVVAGPAEATAIGNVMIQAKAAGLVSDRWEMRRMIADTFKVKTFTPSVILSAFDQVDVLNKAAQIYISARNMGFEPDGMTDAQMKELTDVFGLPK